ncbi:MAG: hypothetical protein J6J97_04480 [Akkermansia sp.]|nr:hypothetical protein [Akkermansia sp.]MBQ8376469.1 hypothetical protein [Akkermansia sp.]
MNAALTAEEQARLAAVLRPGEQCLWQGKGSTAHAAAPSAGLLARLFGKKPQTGGPETLYAITAKRVLAIPPQGEPQEWFLMLGLIQGVEEQPDASGSIIFDYEEQNGQKVPRGITGVPQVARVKNLLADAIDAAYNASPWSV